MYGRSMQALIRNVAAPAQRSNSKHCWWYAIHSVSLTVLLLYQTHAKHNASKRDGKRCPFATHK
jgi:hypothetical protein